MEVCDTRTGVQRSRFTYSRLVDDAGEFTVASRSSSEDRLGCNSNCPACFDGPHDTEVDNWSIGHLCGELGSQGRDIPAPVVQTELLSFLKVNYPSALASEMHILLPSPLGNDNLMHQSA